MDNLLKTEGLPNAIDTLNNKQLAKISFLQQEAKQQQEYICDLKYMLKLNKEAMRILLNSKAPNTANDIDKTDCNSTSNNLNCNLNKSLLDQLFEENHRLTQSIENLIKERNIAQSKALISQQIAEEAENHSALLESELEEKIVELKRIIQDKEYTIQDLEKTTPIPLKDGNFMIYKEIMSPNEKVLKLSAENEVLLKNLNRLTKIEAENKQKLEKNMGKMKVLKQELLKLRYALTNRVNISRLRNYITENLNYFSEDEDIELLQNYCDIRALTNQRKKETKEFFEKIDKKRSIMINSKKSEPTHEKKRVSIVLKEKNIKEVSKIEELQNEIVNLQKSLERESISNKLLLQDMANLKKSNENLLQTNETLLKSINLTQTSLEKLHIENTYYKDYFYKYLHLIKHKHRNSLTEDLLLSLNKDSLPKFDFSPFNSNKGATSRFYINTNPNNNPSTTFIMKNEEDDNSLVLDIKTSQAFLISMARDFYLNSRVRKFYSLNQHLSRICDITSSQTKKDTKNLLKPKRCLSNPLLYISEAGKLLEQEPPFTKKKRFFKKKGKKIIGRPKNEIERLLISPMPSNYELKNGGATPFLLDISKINPFGFEHSFME